MYIKRNAFTIALSSFTLFENVNVSQCSVLRVKHNTHCVRIVSMTVIAWTPLVTVGKIRRKKEK